MDERGRSTEDIRQDIAREEENLSRTAQQIGERINEKLDVSGYVKDSPYWALGIAVGIGFVASRVLRTRTTPMERIMNTFAEEVRNSLGGLHGGAARPGLVRVTLLGIGTKLAAGWIGNAISTSGSSGCVRPPSQAENDSTYNPTATT
jgi:hypothetical protein